MITLKTTGRYPGFFTRSKVFIPVFSSIGIAVDSYIYVSFQTDSWNANVYVYLTEWNNTVSYALGVKGAI